MILLEREERERKAEFYAIFDLSKPVVLSNL